jgi:hypothetical protein
MAGANFLFKGNKMQTTETTTNNVYTENGYKNRRDYLSNLADDYGLDLSEVLAIADMLGANEDFDGLVSSLEDFCM